MKKIFTILLVCMAVSGFGQTFFRTGINGLTNHALDNLVQLGDGSYVCTGYYYSDADRTSGISVVKLNASGGLVASKALLPDGNDSYTEGVSIVKTSDGGFAIGGTINDTMAILKFDASLTLQWHNQYIANAGYSSGSGLLQTADGGFMLTGYLEKAADGTHYYDAAVIVKTKSDGTVDWSKQYFNFGSGTTGSNKAFTAIAALKDGNYAVLGYASPYSNTSLASDSTYLLKINSSGEVLWSAYITTPLSDQTPGSVIATADGSIVVCGNVDKATTSGSNTTKNAQIMLLKFDGSGNLLWSQTSNTSPGADIYTYSVLEDNDGGYICSGEADSTLPGGVVTYKAFLCKTNSNGALQWTKLFSVPSANEYLYGIIKTNDNGYAACGENLFKDPNNADNLLDRGVVYKFTSDIITCGDFSPYGSLQNLNAVATSQTVAVTNVALTIQNNQLSVSSVGTAVNLCSTLPLQLLSFTAAVQNKSVALQWKTANEINTDYFEVERSSNRTLFSAWQKVAARGANGNIETYATNDLQPLMGTSYYRLKQTDKNGLSSYSNIVSVSISAGNTIVISPNPVHNVLHVVLQSNSAASVLLKVTSMDGKNIATQSSRLTQGTNFIDLPMAAVNKGLYVLKIVQNNTVQTIKFVKN